MTYFQGMTDQDAKAYRQGHPDANGCAPEHVTSSGEGYPCRHCLRIIPEGTATLLVAHRPFSKAQPYAETGPVFLCAQGCDTAPSAGRLPDVLTVSPRYLIKGYGPDERIVYGTGAVVPKEQLQTEISARLTDARIAFVDIRSASNNCWLARAQREASHQAG